MTKKILAVILAVLMIAALCACTPNEEEETTTDNRIDINDPENTGSGTESNETGSQVENPPVTDVPGELDYTASEGKVYILHENGAVNLRNADGTVFKSFPNGTELNRIAVSNDGEWTKVVYEGKEYYVVTACVTDIADIDEGFVETSKTLTLATAALSIRIAPSMNNSIIGYFDEGDEIKVIAENATEGWYKVEFVAYGGETKTGYIASNAKYFVETQE